MVKQVDIIAVISVVEVCLLSKRLLFYLKLVVGLGFAIQTNKLHDDPRIFLQNVQEWILLIA